ncbi:MAG TPA: hypothetical protein VMT99_00260 [Candidatus Paceibacterota bacterium]|nr:hypothetical protein [Candidatus Paceibacterota bacterium]
MLYDIYFHNDFDGRASAAVMTAFLRSRGDDVGHFAAVDFDLQDQWMSERFFARHRLFAGRRNPAVVVDFFYHPAAAWWFDHHPTTFKKESWKKSYRPSRERVLDPSYVSCTRLVFESLKKNFGWKPPRLIGDLVKRADIVDGARYRTPRETIYLTTVETQLDAFIDETRKNPATAQRMIEDFATKPLPMIAKQPRIARVVTKLRAKNMKALAFYRRNLKIAGRVSVIDLEKANVETLRYAPYFLKPKIRYAIRITKKDGQFHVGIGDNAWMKPGNVNLGALLARFGGGGHWGAGAVNFTSRKAVDQAVPKMVEALNAAPHS